MDIKKENKIGHLQKLSDSMAHLYLPWLPRQHYFQELKEKFINVIDFEYEIVMVDDGSGDNSWGVMKEIAELDSNIKVFHLVD